MSLLDTILGRHLANSEEKEHRIGVLSGAPTLGLDALDSASYGPEAALAILVPLGAVVHTACLTAPCDFPSASSSAGGHL